MGRKINRSRRPSAVARSPTDALDTDSGNCERGANVRNADVIIIGRQRCRRVGLQPARRAEGILLYPTTQRMSRGRPPDPRLGSTPAARAHSWASAGKAGEAKRDETENPSDSGPGAVAARWPVKAHMSHEMRNHFLPIDPTCGIKCDFLHVSAGPYDKAGALQGVVGLW